MNGLDKAFDEWWDFEPLIADNFYPQDTPVYWAWEGWQAAMKANRKPLMTDEEYEQAMADEGQRRMLEIDTEVRAMIKEAVDAEREACAKICEEPWQGHPYGIAKQIRARGNDAA
jgi:hypothetical protein